jgi:hypothetical protein
MGAAFGKTQNTKTTTGNTNKPPTGNIKPTTGNTNKPTTGNTKPTTGNTKPTTGNNFGKKASNIASSASKSVEEGFEQVSSILGMKKNGNNKKPNQPPIQGGKKRRTRK